MPNASPVQQHHKPHSPEKDLKSAVTSNGHVTSNGLTRMSSYSLELKLDAIDRIQTQVNLNRATLENNNRNIDKIMATLESITMHYNTLLERVRHWEEYTAERQKELVALRQEVSSLKHNPRSAHGGSGVDDKTLEILSGNLATVSSKANEVDNLKITVELLKRKLARMEEQGGFPPDRQRDHLHQQVNSAPQASPPTMSHPQQEARAPTSSYHQGHPDPRDTRHHEPEIVAGNWPTVNQKRPHVNGVEPAHAGTDSPSKRPRLAPLEPRRPFDDPRYEAAARQHEAEEHYRRTESGEYSNHPEHAAAAAAAAAAHQQQQQQHPAQYYERDARDVRDPREPSAQHESQYHSPTMAHSPGRGRPSTSSRGAGRSRKYPDDRERGAWEQTAANIKAGRQMVVDGQVVAVTPNGQWYALGTADSRRSSVAGQSGAPTLSPATQASPQSTIAGPVQGGQILSQTPRDPYAHTKKTRTKPVRNSEGVLIRKDGRPDMRSQSSAANLRKVHARKEEERRMEAEAQQRRAASSQIGDGQSEMAGEDHHGSVDSTPQPYQRHHHHHYRNDGEDDEGEMKPPGSRGSGSGRGLDGADARNSERPTREMYSRSADVDQRSYSRSEGDDGASSTRSVSASAPQSMDPSPSVAHKDVDRMDEDEKKPVVEVPVATETVEATAA
jgi:hypothetical protein